MGTIAVMLAAEVRTLALTASACSFIRNGKLGGVWQGEQVGSRMLMRQAMTSRGQNRPERISARPKNGGT